MFAMASYVNAGEDSGSELSGLFAWKRLRKSFPRFRPPTNFRLDSLASCMIEIQNYDTSEIAGSCAIRPPQINEYVFVLEVQLKTCNVVLADGLKKLKSTDTNKYTRELETIELLRDDLEL